MNWIMVVGAGLGVLILVALIVPSRKSSASQDGRRLMWEQN